jgi:glutamate---cysteine ligase / carboxylate-amine ligase
VRVEEALARSPADGRNASWPARTVGVEEEFFLLWPDGTAAPVAPQLLTLLPGGAHFHPEWMKFQLETVTGVCTDLASLHGELVAQRSAVQRAARSCGALMVATGTPPFGVPGLTALTDDERYRGLQARFPGPAADVVTCGCHVHVGVPDRELGVQALNRVRAWLPVLLALSCNSPMWAGRDSGWDSYRHLMFSRWPSARVPPSCADVREYDAALDHAISAGDADSPAGVYWFARLSARFPTLEFRIADTGMTVADTELLATLCRALVETSVAEALAGRPVAQVTETVLESSILSAAQFGLSSLLVDPRTGVLAPAHAVLYQLVDLVSPALRAADERTAVSALLAVRRSRRSGAARQRGLREGLEREAFVSALAAASLPGEPTSDNAALIRQG